MTRGLQVLLCALALVLTTTPAWAHCRSENRVWGFSEKSSNVASQETAKPAEPPQENPGCGYDFASGMHKYLYCQNNPINGYDPSGHFDMGSMLVTSAIIGGLSGAVIGGVENGAKGAAYGAISGAVLGPLTALGVTVAGAGISGGLYAAFGTQVVTPQLASFIVGSGVAAYGISSIDSQIDQIDVTSPTAKSEIKAAEIELIMMFVSTAASPLALNRSAMNTQAEASALRGAYKQENARIAALAESLTRQGIPLRNIAEQVSAARRQNRISIRSQMSEWLDVTGLKARDLFLYGDTDGPTFSYLENQARDSGKTGDDIWRAIISSSSRSHAATDNRIFNK